MFEFVVPTGQRFAFQMDSLGAKLILGALSKTLNKIEAETGPIDIPRQQ